jgi:hypothetical protein
MEVVSICRARLTPWRGRWWGIFVRPPVARVDARHERVELLHLDQGEDVRQWTKDAHHFDVPSLEVSSHSPAIDKAGFVEIAEPSNAICANSRSALLRDGGFSFLRR